MFTQSGYIVVLWLLPVVLCIVTPLTMLAGWGLVKLVRKSAEKSLVREEQKQSRREEDIAEDYRHGIAA